VAGQIVLDQLESQEALRLAINSRSEEQLMKSIEQALLSPAEWGVCFSWFFVVAREDLNQETNQLDTVDLVQSTSNFIKLYFGSWRYPIIVAVMVHSCSPASTEAGSTSMPLLILFMGLAPMTS